MPVHDWARVIPGIFHDFHQRWIGAIRDHLNAGLLPPEFTPWRSKSRKDPSRTSSPWKAANGRIPLDGKLRPVA